MHACDAPTPLPLHVSTVRFDVFPTYFDASFFPKCSQTPTDPFPDPCFVANVTTFLDHCQPSKSRQILGDTSKSDPYLSSTKRLFSSFEFLWSTACIYIYIYMELMNRFWFFDYSKSFEKLWEIYFFIKYFYYRCRRLFLGLGRCRYFCKWKISKM